jgi:hypothetical protein
MKEHYYMRVLPRDAFNDANLLKCVGQLALIAHDYGLPGKFYLMELNQLVILQNPNDGSTFVNNFVVYNGHSVFLKFHRPLNSREPWPLMVTDLDIEVFDKDGQLSPELTAYLESPDRC